MGKVGVGVAVVAGDGVAVVAGVVGAVVGMSAAQEVTKTRKRNF